MAHATQERYSALVDAKLRATLVQKDGIVWNNRYEGDPKAGAVKVPVRDTEVTVAAYNEQNGAGKAREADELSTSRRYFQFMTRKKA